MEDKIGKIIYLNYIGKPYYLKVEKREDQNVKKGTINKCWKCFYYGDMFYSCCTDSKCSNTNRIDGLHIYYKEIDIKDIRKIKLNKIK